MTIVFFVIAALALIGAGVLLWLDRNRSEQVHHQRAVWGQKHSFQFRDSDSKLRSAFSRAAMDVPEHVAVRDVAAGLYQGAEAVVFDLEETATVVAVRRPAASSVTVDLRYEDVLAPAEEDVDLLGAMGSRVMFASNLDAARRICDRRMVALATDAPAYLEILWNEGNWALGSMPLTTDDERLDTALDTVRRFADLLRVLPPAVDPQDTPDPRDPHGPTREELADEKTESLRDKARRRRLAESAGMQSPPPPAPWTPAAPPVAPPPLPPQPMGPPPMGPPPQRTSPQRPSPMEASPRPAPEPFDRATPAAAPYPSEPYAVQPPALDPIDVPQVDLPPISYAETQGAPPSRPTPIRRPRSAPAESPELPPLTDPREDH